MAQEDVVIITSGSGFVGSALIEKLSSPRVTVSCSPNARGRRPLWLL
jgi:nucleoside-diphosphate-sugar epimerase